MYKMYWRRPQKTAKVFVKKKQICRAIAHQNLRLLAANLATNFLFFIQKRTVIKQKKEDKIPLFDAFVCQWPHQV